MATPVPAIEVEKLTRRFGEVLALDQINLSIQQGEFFSLLGPSGCGKTTLLRIIAGLDIPDEGKVSIGGVDAGGLPAHRRPVNTVFQSYALFPHLNVWENVAFGLRMKKVPPPEIEQRVRKVMALVEIEPLAQRKPNQLSGGQKQRVALARAIVNEPQVLLLDEPLGALDLKLRKQLQIELRSLQRRLGITFIYVTHDQDEALVLSDRIAVMRDGKVEQLGDAAALYEHPRTRFVSQFLGSCSLIEGRVKQRNSNSTLVETTLGELKTASAAPAREKITLAIRPEKVQLLPCPAVAGENRIRARIEQVIYVGSGTHYELRAGTQPLRAEVMNSHAGSNSFQIGQELLVCLPPEALIVLDD
ncbi:MAG: ABC transporter ATP-binding protein [Pedosphaera sp.]|nr:ABC transporter ATP-binding protein [Pedosphaera sp.]